MLRVEGVCLSASWLSGTKELPQDQVSPTVSEVLALLLTVCTIFLIQHKLLQQNK